MHIRNNYEKGVFNGEIGKIVDLSVMKKSLTVLYDGTKSRRVEYIGYDLDELVLAYATTIHKSQGNEYPVVIIPLTMTHSFMLQRNLIYTALTRAKKLCIFVGTRIALYTAISNIKPSMRNSRLKERLQTLIRDEKE
jgi:exodeoxyribonuclease V alpha subunit